MNYNGYSQKERLHLYMDFKFKEQKSLNRTFTHDIFIASIECVEIFINDASNIRECLSNNCPLECDSYSFEIEKDSDFK